MLHLSPSKFSNIRVILNIYINKSTKGQCQFETEVRQIAVFRTVVIQTSSAPFVVVVVVVVVVVLVSYGGNFNWVIPRRFF